MTDYTKLIENCRKLATWIQPEKKSMFNDWEMATETVLFDAADAIEALQEYLAASNDEVNHLAESNKELQAELNEQLPKRGKWIHDVAVQGTTAGGVTFYHGYTCSVCGALMGRKGDAYCYKCGAKMIGEQEVRE